MLDLIGLTSGNLTIDFLSEITLVLVLLVLMFDFIQGFFPTRKRKE